MRSMICFAVRRSGSGSLGTRSHASTAHAIAATQTLTIITAYDQTPCRSASSTSSRIRSLTRS